jgi:hypothetical protein
LKLHRLLFTLLLLLPLLDEPEQIAALAVLRGNPQHLEHLLPRHREIFALQ